MQGCVHLAFVFARRRFLHLRPFVLETLAAQLGPDVMVAVNGFAQNGIINPAQGKLVFECRPGNGRPNFFWMS